MIQEAVNAGCYVVAPDYLVFAVQLTVPFRVGRPYAELSEIGEALFYAVSDRRSGRLISMPDGSIAQLTGSWPILGGEMGQVLDF